MIKQSNNRFHKTKQRRVGIVWGYLTARRPGGERGLGPDREVHVVGLERRPAGVVGVRPGLAEHIARVAAGELHESVHHTGVVLALPLRPTERRIPRTMGASRGSSPAAGGGVDASTAASIRAEYGKGKMAAIRGEDGTFKYSDYYRC